MAEEKSKQTSIHSTTAHKISDEYKATEPDRFETMQPMVEPKPTARPVTVITCTMCLNDMHLMPSSTIYSCYYCGSHRHNIDNHTTMSMSLARDAELVRTKAEESMSKL